MHVGRLRARQGPVHDHRVRADRRAHHAALPAAPDHRAASSRSTTSARRRGAPRTSSGTTRTCSRSIRSTPRTAASATATWCRSPAAPARRRCTRAISERMQPGVVYTTFHHPGHRRQRDHHRVLRLGDQLPGVQGDGRAGAAAPTSRRSGRSSIAATSTIRGGSHRRCRRPNERGFRPTGMKTAALARSTTAGDGRARRCANGASAPITRGARRGGAGRPGLQRHQPRRDDGDAGRSRGFRPRLHPQRGHRRRARTS